MAKRKATWIAEGSPALKKRRVSSYNKYDSLKVKVESPRLIFPNEEDDADDMELLLRPDPNTSNQETFVDGGTEGLTEEDPIYLSSSDDDDDDEEDEETPPLTSSATEPDELSDHESTLQNRESNSQEYNELQSSTTEPLKSSEGALQYSQSEAPQTVPLDFAEDDDFGVFDFGNSYDDFVPDSETDIAPDNAIGDKESMKVAERNGVPSDGLGQDNQVEKSNNGNEESTTDDHVAADGIKEPIDNELEQQSFEDYDSDDSTIEIVDVRPIPPKVSIERLEELIDRTRYKGLLKRVSARNLMRSRIQSEQMQKFIESIMRDTP